MSKYNTIQYNTLCLCYAIFMVYVMSRYAIIIVYFSRRDSLQ